MKNILIPTDFSDNANSALDYALKLLSNENSTFFLLHSTHFVNKENRTHITPHYVNKLQKEGRKKLKELELKVNDTNSNIKHSFKCVASTKKLSIAIDKNIKENNIDLIIMGTKGVTASNEIFAGSNTIEIVNKIKGCPILVIPDNQVYANPKQIAFATDFGRFYDDIELGPLKMMANRCNSEIKIVHINENSELSDIQEYNKELLNRHLANFKHSFHYLDNSAKKSESIEAFIKEFNVDMLAMINYKHGLLEKIFNEPVIKKLIFHPKIPLLIIS